MSWTTSRPGVPRTDGEDEQARPGFICCHAFRAGNCKPPPKISALQHALPACGSAAPRETQSSSRAGLAVAVVCTHGRRKILQSGNQYACLRSSWISAARVFRAVAGRRRGWPLSVVSGDTRPRIVETNAQVRVRHGQQRSQYVFVVEANGDSQIYTSGLGTITRRPL